MTRVRAVEGCRLSQYETNGFESTVLFKKLKMIETNGFESILHFQEVEVEIQACFQHVGSHPMCSHPTCSTRTSDLTVLGPQHHVPRAQVTLLTPARVPQVVRRGSSDPLHTTLMRLTQPWLFFLFLVFLGFWCCGGSADQRCVTLRAQMSPPLSCLVNEEVAHRDADVDERKASQDVVPRAQ